jgi:excisionase family DNA binding protein
METRNDGRKLDLTQAAPFLGVSPHTLRAWTRERRIPFHRCGRRIVFALVDLERFLADNRVEARGR